MSSFQSSEAVGPDRSVSNNVFSSVTLDELALKAREREQTVISNYNNAAHPKTGINPNGVRIAEACFSEYFY